MINNPNLLQFLIASERECYPFSLYWWGVEQIGALVNS